MLSRGVPTKTTTAVSNSKMLHERLASDLSDSSTDSGVMGLKKPLGSSTVVPPTSSNQSLGNGGVPVSVSNTSSNNSAGAKGMALQQQDLLAVPEGFDSTRRPSAGMIKVKLASASPQWDNKAEVEVDCENPDEVVDKMLQSIVDKFPPTSVITVEKGGVPVGTVHAPVPQHHPQHPSGQSPRSQDKSLPTGAIPSKHPFGSYPGNAPPQMSHPMHPQYPQVLPPYGAQHPQFPPYLQHPMYPNKQPTQDLNKLGNQPPASNKKHATASSVSSNIPQPQQPESKMPMSSLLQEVPKFVPKVEVREIVKEVPKIEIEWVEKIVEVPQISYVDKYEEVPQIQEVVKHVPKYETVDVPREVIKYVPRVVTKIVENVVEVARGERIPIMRPQPVDTAFVVPRFQDRNVPVEMSRCIIPEIEETDEVVEVEVSKYVPYLVPVDVYVPLPVTVPVKFKNGGEQTELPCTNADPNLLQHLMIEMNPHLQQLELFNFNQQELFQQNVHQSIQQARECGVAPPMPIVDGPIIRQGGGVSANITSSFPTRHKSGVSRSSSAGASRRQSRQVSRRVTAGGGTTRGGSQFLPPTMMINAPPPQYGGYPPMYSNN